jgi:hypothetical protein
MNNSGFVSILLATAILPASPSALAQSPAEEALHRGVELRRQRRDEEALAEFRHAYTLSPSPKARAQAALAEQALGSWLAAEDDLVAAMAAMGDSWIEQNRATLDRALERIRTHLGAIEVVADVAGAELRVNGALVGSLPHALRVEVGTVRLDVTAPGYAPSQRDSVVTPGVFLREAFHLVALPARTDGPQTEAQSPALAPLHGDAPAGPSKSTTSTWGWLAVAGAGAFLGGGIAATIWRYDEVERYNSNPACSQTERPATCNGLRGDANTATALAIVGYAAAGAMAVTATVLIVSTRRTNLSATAWVDPNGAGAEFRANF